MISYFLQIITSLNRTKISTQWVAVRTNGDKYGKEWNVAATWNIDKNWMTKVGIRQI